RAPARPFLVAGIARPERFRQDAEGLTRVAGARFFADHHRYLPQDLRDVEREAQAAGADALVITAKDAVRFPVELCSRPVFVLAVAGASERGGRLRGARLAGAGGAA